MNHAQSHVAGNITSFLWGLTWPLLIGALLGALISRTLDRYRLRWTWAVAGFPLTYCLWFVERRIGVVCLAASIAATWIGIQVHNDAVQAGGEEARSGRGRLGPFGLLRSAIGRRRARRTAGRAGAGTASAAAPASR